MRGLDERHPGVQDLASWFEYAHLSAGPRRQISAVCAAFAQDIITLIKEDSPELTAGLRKLLEAKDCFVRATIAQERNAK